MKKIRIFSIVLLSLLLGVLFISRDKLVSFAEENNVSMLNDTHIIKNNTSYLFNDYLEISGYSSRCLFVQYFDGNNNILNAERFCTSPNTETHVVINNDAAEYWLVSALYLDSTSAVLNLIPFEYKAPDFYLNCSPDKITTDTYATCTVTAETSFNMSKIQFDLSLDDFIIYDEVALDDVSDLQKNENHYVLTPKHIQYSGTLSSHDDYTPFDEPVEVSLMEFKIRTEKDQEVAVLGNIKLNNLDYTDVLGSSHYENLTSTVGQDKDESAMAQNKEEKENPKTQDFIILAAVLLVISFAVILTVHFTRKKAS